MPALHPTASVHPSLALPDDIEIGPWSVVDAEVSLGPGVRIGPFCHLYPGTVLEDGVSLSDGVILGHAPQDLKYRGEKTGLRVGEGTALREYATVHRGSSPAGITRIGKHCLIMAYAHVGHDGVLEDQVILANAAQLGGHVFVGQGAVVSGLTGVHQFTAIGAGAFVGGGLRVDRDVPPFCKALGDPVSFGGVNEAGLAKRGGGDADRKSLKEFYRALFEAGPKKAGAAEAVAMAEAARAEGRVWGGPMLDFLRRHRRSLLVKRPGAGVPP